MKVLFLHPNQPSQFKLPAIELAKDPNNEVVFLSRKNLEIPVPGVKVIGFSERIPPGEKPHMFTRKFTEGCHRATAVAGACWQLKKQGFTPDVIVAHSGWGDGMYLRTIFPDTPQLAYMEFFFQPSGADLGFDPSREINANLLATRTTDNAIHMMNYFNADWCVSPTYWQRSVHPIEMHEKISVLHEGVDTELCAPKQWQEYRLPNGKVLNPDTDEIITHVERHFDNYRGFSTVLQAIDKIQKRRPNAHVVIVGKEGDGYSGSQKGAFLQQIKQTPFDRERTHFVGHLNYRDYLTLLQVSSAHIYLTYPFVLSWSFLEAMSVACPIICSGTAPIKEVAENEKNCLMFDFYNSEELADCVDKLLDDRDYGKKLGAAAREKMLEQYDVRDILPMSVQLIKDIADGKNPRDASGVIQQWNIKWGRENESWQQSIPLFQ